MTNLGPLILVGIGLLFFVHGFLLLKDYGQGWWYLAIHTRAGAIYAEFPWGIACFLMGVSAYLEPSYTNKGINPVAYIVVGLGITGFLLMLIRPSFLKPAWFKRLESEYVDFVSVLAVEATDMGFREWSKRMQTQEDIEEWAAQVREEFMRGLRERKR